MKKLLLYVSACMLLATCSYAQRNCGTMENLELRKKQDPTLEKRMMDDEKKLNEWIKKNYPQESDYITLPSIPGYVPTGNLTVDRVNYAKAKEAYLAKNPSAKHQYPASTSSAAGNEKRRSRSTQIK